LQKGAELQGSGYGESNVHQVPSYSSIKAKLKPGFEIIPSSSSESESDKDDDDNSPIGAGLGARPTTQNIRSVRRQISKNLRGKEEEMVYRNSTILGSEDEILELPLDEEDASLENTDSNGGGGFGTALEYYGLEGGQVPQQQHQYSSTAAQNAHSSSSKTSDMEFQDFTLDDMQKLSIRKSGTGQASFQQNLLEINNLDDLEDMDGLMEMLDKYLRKSRYSKMVLEGTITPPPQTSTMVVPSSVRARGISLGAGFAVQQKFNQQSQNLQQQQLQSESLGPSNVGAKSLVPAEASHSGAVIGSRKQSLVNASEMDMDDSADDLPLATLQTLKRGRGSSMPVAMTTALLSPLPSAVAPVISSLKKVEELDEGIKDREMEKEKERERELKEKEKKEMLDKEKMNLILSKLSEANVKKVCKSILHCLTCFECALLNVNNV
jgi:hypothetical protein